MFTNEKLRSLNGLEMTVYNYVVQNMDKVPYMKIRELADEAHVSTTTVMNFCKKMGVDGYIEFKVKLKQYNQRPRQESREMDTNSVINCLRQMESGELRESIERAAAMLGGAKSILFHGIGNSGQIARYGARYFSNLRRRAWCMTDPFETVPQGDPRENVAVILSVSGETTQIIESATSMKERGWSILSITDGRNNTLDRISDCAIAYYVPQERMEDWSDLTSQVPALHIIEILGRKLYRADAEADALPL